MLNTDEKQEMTDNNLINYSVCISWF